MSTPIDAFLSGSDPLGSVKYFPFYGSNFIDASNNTWLKAGIQTGVANVDARLLSQNQYKVSAIGATISVSGGGGQQGMASNGSGTIICGSGTVGNIVRSTDGGTTWGQVTVSTLTVGGFAWNGSRFVVTANDAATFQIWTSPTGAAGTWVNHVSVAKTQINAGSASVAANTTSGVCLAAMENNSIGGVYTSDAAGTTWTVRNLPVALSSTTAPSVGTQIMRPIYAGGNWAVGHPTSLCFYSTTDFITWTLRTPSFTLPSAASWIGAFTSHNSNNLAVVSMLSPGYLKTADCITYTQFDMSNAPAYPGHVEWDGTDWICLAQTSPYGANGNRLNSSVTSLLRSANLVDWQEYPIQSVAESQGNAYYIHSPAKTAANKWTYIKFGMLAGRKVDISNPILVGLSVPWVDANNIPMFLRIK